MQELSLFQMFDLGGLFMWPLLVFSVVTIALILERGVYLLFHDLRVKDLQRALDPYLEKKDHQGALTWLATQPSRKSGVKILSALFKVAPQGEHCMEKAVEAEAGERIRKLENGFNFLTALASLSPLTGFLGTVSGMIGAFRSIATATEVNAQLVANGIYEALITTVFGLIIAVFAIAGYNLFAHKVDKFAAELEKTASDIIGTMV